MEERATAEEDHRCLVIGAAVLVSAAAAPIASAAAISHVAVGQTAMPSEEGHEVTAVPARAAAAVVAHPAFPEAEDSVEGVEDSAVVVVADVEVADDASDPRTT